MGYSVKKIWFFDKPGEENTRDAIQIAVERAKELGVSKLVVASTSGKTALAASHEVRGTGISLIVVSHVVGFSSPGIWEFDTTIADQLRGEGVRIVTGTHVFSGLERAFSSSQKVTGGSRSEAVAEAFRRVIATGVKVAVECVLIAADQGAIPVTEEVIALGGTGTGADTVCVIRPSNTSRFFDLQVREIVAMPRNR